MNAETMPQAERAIHDRKSACFAALNYTAMTSSTGLPDGGWEIKVEFGSADTGQFQRFMSPAAARELAAALIAAADHYDAETARLGGAA